MDKNYIHSCLRWLANELVPYYNTEKLSTELMSKIDVFYDSINRTLDWYSLTKEDLLKLGFLNWEESTTEEGCLGIWFIPCWLFPVIPEGITLYDAAGKSFSFKKLEASRKSMYGCLTYGIKLKSAEVVSTDE